MDSVISIQKGSRYVIPIYILGEQIYSNADEVISGDISRESVYSTSYPFHPQIEAVEDGYIVPNDWNTLITDECTKIIVDIPLENGDFFKDKMYFVPENVFDERMSEIINRETKYN